MNLMDDMVTDSSLNVTVKRNHHVRARIMFSHVQFGQELIGRVLWNMETMIMKSNVKRMDLTRRTIILELG